MLNICPDFFMLIRNQWAHEAVPDFSLHFQKVKVFFAFPFFDAVTLPKHVFAAGENWICWFSGEP